jgi:hypothetical protein
MRSRPVRQVTAPASVRHLTGPLAAGPRGPWQVSDTCFQSRCVTAPVEETGSRRIWTSGNREASSRAHASAACVRAQTTTLGSEPDSVAPRPRGAAGRGQRQAAARCRHGTARGAGRGAPEQASPAGAAPAPPQQHRPGSRCRDSAVDTVASGTSTIGTAGASAAMRMKCRSHVTQTPPARAAARLSACPSSSNPAASRESGSGVPPAGKLGCNEPQPTVAALDPSPRSLGIRSVQRKRQPSGDASCENARAPRCSRSPPA